MPLIIKKGKNRNIPAKEANKAMYQESIQKWRLEWDNCQEGSWTKKLFPKVGDESNHNRAAHDFHLSQALSGLGVFKAYLRKMHRIETSQCKCGHEDETAEHVLTECPRFADGWPTERLSGTNPHHRGYMKKVV